MPLRNSSEWIKDNNENITGNRTEDDKCGIMSDKIMNSFMTCAFWMEGVLLLVTGIVN